MSDDPITREEAEDIANRAAEIGSHKALKQTFALLGVDIDDFESVQDFRGDLQWVKSGRRLSRSIGTKTGSSILGVFALGIGVALFDMIKRALFHP